jgi:hypothetical protein
MHHGDDRLAGPENPSEPGCHNPLERLLSKGMLAMEEVPVSPFWPDQFAVSFGRAKL